ncbi:MAG: hypothetical protein DRI48_10220 [Chloroflexi bacterium]|nr:MAG: hypothetical protein DRI48_10220 [Chloroflexota bacterium]
MLFSITSLGDADCWFASSIYEETIIRYKLIDQIIDEADDCTSADKLISASLQMWSEMKPLNTETLYTTCKFLTDVLKGGSRLTLVSLTCPAYTVGREGIANQWVRGRVHFFCKLAARSLRAIREDLREWHIYVWDGSGLGDETLRPTIHPKLLAQSSVAEQLDRNWNLFSDVASELERQSGIKVVLKKYVDLLPEILRARDILEALEAGNGFLSKGLQRIMKQGAEDYAKMGEDIWEHWERFRNDSYIYAGAVLKYGAKDNRAGDYSLMVSIESRIHHITGLRLYHFSYNDETLLMPVWNYPSWIRSFYWANTGNLDTDSRIRESSRRWVRFDKWVDLRDTSKYQP